MAGWFLGIFVLVISGCSQPAVPETVEAPSLVPTSVAETIQPTHTPSPSPPPQARAVLLAGPDADPEQVSQLQALLGDLAAQDGLLLETLQTRTPNDLTPEVKVVIALAPDPGLASLAEAAPNTAFIAIDFPDPAPAANVSQVSLEAALPDQQGFLAGYLAAVVTPDWRVGVISSGDTPAGKANRSGFLNGVIFYCGLCRPAFPPFVQYPLSVELPGNPSPAEVQAAADSLISQGVTTVYVPPGVGDTVLFEYLAQNGINMIGTLTPPGGMSAHWIATLRSDWQTSLRQAWEQAVGGQSSDGSVPVLAITDVNEALFSVGRQRIIEQVRDELAAGLIDTGVDLLTGELK